MMGIHESALKKSCTADTCLEANISETELWGINPLLLHRKYWKKDALIWVKHAHRRTWALSSFSSNCIFSCTKTPMQTSRIYLYDYLRRGVWSTEMESKLPPVFFFFFLLQLATMTTNEATLAQPQPFFLDYHNGTLLKGNFSLNLLWYGRFSFSQRAIVVDFLTSLSENLEARHPTVASWWRTTESYVGGAPALSVKRQTTIRPKKRTLLEKDIQRLAAAGRRKNAISVLLTADDVTVEGFCMSRCGTHGWGKKKRTRARFPYIWVGNSASQCPGQCAWPFHRPIYGPQTPPLVAPNGDVGVDGMVVNLAGLLAGTVTNPFNGGFFRGTTEAVSACAGIFGSGAYPGYPGRVLVDMLTGGGYNAAGAAGRKFLLPAMWDPKTSQCATLV